jgi:hypothetical protein
MRMEEKRRGKTREMRGTVWMVMVRMRRTRGEEEEVVVAVVVVPPVSPALSPRHTVHYSH